MHECMACNASEVFFVLYFCFRLNWIEENVTWCWWYGTGTLCHFNSQPQPADTDSDTTITLTAGCVAVMTHIHTHTSNTDFIPIQKCSYHHIIQHTLTLSQKMYWKSKMVGWKFTKFCFCTMRERIVLKCILLCVCCCLFCPNAAKYYGMGQPTSLCICMISIRDIDL